MGIVLDLLVRTWKNICFILSLEKMEKTEVYCGLPGRAGHGTLKASKMQGDAEHACGTGTAQCKDRGGEPAAGSRGQRTHERRRTLLSDPGLGRQLDRKSVV